jgi:hypothetical protein
VQMEDEVGGARAGRGRVGTATARKTDIEHGVPPGAARRKYAQGFGAACVCCTFSHVSGARGKLTTHRNSYSRFAETMLSLNGNSGVSKSFARRAVHSEGCDANSLSACGA